LAAYKKNAQDLGAHIVFVDESGFLLIPPVRKTWSPVGKTPVCRHRYRHERVSVISGVSVSPKRRHMGLYFQLHEKNVRRGEVVEFLRYLLKHLRGAVIVLWDNAQIHRGEPIRQLCKRFARLHLEMLPPYAPELNPDEGVWSQVKNSMANSRCDNIDDLRVRILEELIKLSLSQTNLRACIHRSELPPL